MLAPCRRQGKPALLAGPAGRNNRPDILEPWTASNRSTVMKDNANLIIQGQRVLLVPYRPEHVPQYHKWMQVRCKQQ